MKKIYQLLGKNNPIKGDFGVEIEIEGENLVPLEDPHWTTKKDGSLRGAFPEQAAEYVFKKPLSYDKVRPALESLADCLKDSKLNFSFRTSVHVHVNVQDMNMTQVLNFIYAYLLVEEPLMNFCGDERIGNRFCLRLSDAEGLVNTLNRMMERGDDALRAIEEEAVRYAAVNVAALRNYGSLEFRGMRGNLDVDILTTWVGTLHNLRKFACEMESPDAIYAMFMEMGAARFFKEVVGEYAPKYRYAKLVKDVQRSFSLSIDIPFKFTECAEQARKRPKAKPEVVVAGHIPMGFEAVRAFQAFVGDIPVEIR